MAQRRTIERRNYPYLQISWYARGSQQQGWAYLDTGFEGYLSVPESMMESLGLPDYLTPYRLAGGQLVWAPTYDGTLSLLGLDVPMSALIIALGTELLLGRQIIDHLIVTFEYGQRIEARE